MSDNNGFVARKDELLSVFEGVINELITADDIQKRRKAEENLTKLQQNNAVLFYECCIELTLRSNNNQIRQLCIVLFRQNVSPNSNLFDKMPKHTYKNFEIGLITALKNEKNKVTYLAICDALGTFASRIINDGYWDDLIPTLSQLATQENTFHKEGFLRIIDCLAEFNIEFIKKSITQVKNLLTASLNDNDDNVKIAGFRSLTSIVTSLKTENYINEFKCLVPLCIKLLEVVRDNELLTIIGEILQAIVYQRTALFYDNINELNKLCGNIINNSNYGFDTRKLMFETLVSLCHGGSKVRSNKEFVAGVVKINFKFLCNYDDSLDFNDKNNDSEQDYIEHGRTAISDLCRYVGSKTF